MADRSASHVLKQTVRLLIAHGLYAVGLLQLWARLRLRHGAVVLTYHRVLSGKALGETWSHPGMIVSRTTFEAHLDVLSRHFAVLSLPEFAARVEAKRPFDRPACLITFDDGWCDTFSEAWPALLRRKLPAVVFLPADLVGTRLPFWREELGDLLYRCWEGVRTDAPLRERVASLLGASGLVEVLDAPDAGAARRRIRFAIHALQAGVDGPEARRLAGALRAVLGEYDRSGCDRLMTWEQAHQMAADGVRFGGHGATHTPLTQLSREELTGEVERARRRIEEETGSEVLSFSYPNGDFDPDVIDCVRAAGFRLSFSTRPGVVRSGADPLALPRINIHQAASTAPLLLARVAGLF